EAPRGAARDAISRHARCATPAWAVRAARAVAKAGAQKQLQKSGCTNAAAQKRLQESTRRGENRLLQYLRMSDRRAHPACERRAPMRSTILETPKKCLIQTAAARLGTIRLARRRRWTLTLFPGPRAPRRRARRRAVRSPQHVPADRVA